MKVQSEKRFTLAGKFCALAAVFVLQAVLICQTSLTVNAQGTTKVTASGAKIRSSASTGSEALASVSKDDKLDVLAQTTDSEGYTWYKVYVNGKDTGYIRADLVGDISGSIQTESAGTSSEATTSSTTSTNTNETTQVTTEYVQVTESEASAGKVLGESVNVRENPSTNATIAGKATGGTEVAITGQAVDGSGKVWYQVSYGDVTGFIRSDFLEITQNVEAEPEEPDVEEEAPVEEETTPVNKDYELVYEANAEGVEEWFLYDYTRGTKQSLNDLLTVVRKSQENEQGAVSQLKTFKVISVVLGVIVLALVVAVTILIFKLRDSYEYVYEDDDEEEDDEEEDEEDEIEEDEDEDEEEEPVRRPLSKKSSRTTSHAAKQTSDARVFEKTASSKNEGTWQSKNFLDIDDDMEFEFLDLK